MNTAAIAEGGLRKKQLLPLTRHFESQQRHAEKVIVVP
jgi:hypothetical protein